MIISFCGHRDFISNKRTYINLLTVLDKLIAKYRHIEFYCSYQGNFDLYILKFLNDNKNTFVHKYKIYLITPYINDKRLFSLKNMVDNIVFPPIENINPKYAINATNKWKIDNSDILISNIDHTWGGAYLPYRYAITHKKTIINLNSINGCI